MKVEMKRVNDAVRFEATGSATPVKVQIEGSPEIGGEGKGVRPMELVLMALGSCGVMDFVSILKKQKQDIRDISVSVDGQRADTIPAVFTRIHILFKVSGNVDSNKAEKAADLAVKKYCSVQNMLAAGGVEITYSVSISK